MKPTRSLSSLTGGPPLKRPHLSFNPLKVATKEAADAVDADPPLSKLIDILKEGINHPMKGNAVVYWMRMSDLRLHDNHALSLASKTAMQQNIPLIVLFLISPEDYIAHDRAARRIDFTLRNLEALRTSLSETHIPLCTITHTPRKTLPSRVISFLSGLGCYNLFGNIEYELDEIRRDISVCKLAKLKGIGATFVHNKCVIQPGAILTAQNKAYEVFSPYHRRWVKELNNKSEQYLSEYPFSHSNDKSMRTLAAFSDLFDCNVPESIMGFELNADDKRVMIECWPAGEVSAKALLQRFLTTKARHSQLGAVDPLNPGAEESRSMSRIASYCNDRDRADGDTTSRLSVYLSSGVLSARTCVREILLLQQSHLVDGQGDSGIGRWLQELCWRDFYNIILAAHPRVSMGRPFHEKYSTIVWEESQEPEAGIDSNVLQRWKDGKTGVPVVDAAMRCINRMGWVHNRLRMISAMYLTKDLMVDWRLGERYFMEQLVDGDLATNNGGWQWCASTGVDACPYFRIFNPYSQSSKVDPAGEFIRLWVPELSKLSGSELYNPPGPIADRLGYPRPIITHEDARGRALRRFKHPGVC
ncbi:hypothetical protein AMATHDRAFT_73951 [Amanita thiersii Skay4041]|uniref:Photolyase/cryptochrome alpha/beta domain-containing protein n=1 Tax=Amanita thiersii Skay4041 TaxID=703135 RepID=A0A2A9NY10_9AGAR|nr:hypothetical protein AMATHDRAFT_73951 [Amanita thiersii Skay4041]